MTPLPIYSHSADTHHTHPDSPRLPQIASPRKLLEMIRCNETCPFLDLSYRSKRQYHLPVDTYRPRLRGVDAGISIANCLLFNTAVTELRFEDSDLGQEGCHAIAEALKVRSSVQTLHLGGNIKGTESEGSRVVACILASCPFLRTLHYQDNALDVHGLQAMIEELQSHSTLTALDLSNNPKLADDRCITLSRLVRECTSLTSLNLVGTGIGGAGGQEIGDAIRNNSTLKSLTIGDGPFSSKEGEAVLDGITSNKTLCSLRLVGCKISSCAISKLMQGLTNNPCFISLSFEQMQSLHERECTAIADCMSCLSNLKELNLYQMRFSPRHKDKIGAGICSMLRTSSTLSALRLDVALFREHEEAMIEALELSSSMTEFSFTEGTALRNSKVDEILERNAHNRRVRGVSLLSCMLHAFNDE